MVEKKLDTIKLFDELADLLGYRLEKKDRESIPPELPQTTKNFEEMSIRELTTEIRDLDVEIQKIGTVNQRIKQTVINFMNNQQANEITQPIFEGSRFEDRRLQIYDREMVLKKNLEAYLRSLFKRAIEKEMTEKFVTLNPDFRGIIKDMSVKQTSQGMCLIVETGKIAETKLDNFMIQEEREQSQVKSKGATTSKSIGDLGGRI